MYISTSITMCPILIAIVTMCPILYCVVMDSLPLMMTLTVSIQAPIVPSGTLHLTSRPFSWLAKENNYQQ